MISESFQTKEGEDGGITKGVLHCSAINLTPHLSNRAGGSGDVSIFCLDIGRLILSHEIKYHRHSREKKVLINYSFCWELNKTLKQARKLLLFQIFRLRVIFCKLLRKIDQMYQIFLSESNEAFFAFIFSRFGENIATPIMTFCV